MIVQRFLYIFRDSFSAAPWIVSNAIIFSPGEQSVFLRCIESIAENTRTGFYGITSLCPTGPNLFGRQLALSVDLGDFTCGETVRINRSNSSFSFVYLSPEGEVISTSVKRGGGISSLGAKVDNKYDDFYNSKDIYNSNDINRKIWSASEYQKKGFLKFKGPETLGSKTRVYEEGYAIIGPYMPLNEGNYKARFVILFSDLSNCKEMQYFIDVCYDYGRAVFARSDDFFIEISNEEVELIFDFVVKEKNKDFEIRLHLNKAISFEFKSFELMKT